MASCVLQGSLNRRNATRTVTESWLSTFQSSGAGAGGGIAHFAHLGGLITGFLYMRSDWRPGGQLARIKKAASRSRRLAIVPRDESVEEHPGVDAPARRPREEAVLCEKVDSVLDKISATGMSSLTPGELKLLDEVSKRHRTN